MEKKKEIKRVGEKKEKGYEGGEKERQVKKEKDSFKKIQRSL